MRQNQGEVNRGKESRKSTGIIHETSNILLYNGLYLSTTNRVSSTIRKSSRVSWDRTAWRRTKLGVQEDVRPGRRRGDPPHYRRGFVRPDPNCRAAGRASLNKCSVGPGDQQAGDPAQCIVAADPDSAVVRFPHRFGGNKRAGLESREVFKPACSSWAQRGWREAPFPRPQQARSPEESRTIGGSSLSTPT